MTYGQAFQQAAREHGFSDQEIAERMQFVRTVNPNTDGMRNMEIPAGMESETLKIFKELMARMDAAMKQDPEGFKNRVLARLANEASKN